MSAIYEESKNEREPENIEEEEEEAVDEEQSEAIQDVIEDVIEEIIQEDAAYDQFVEDIAEEITREVADELAREIVQIQDELDEVEEIISREIEQSEPVESRALTSNTQGRTFGSILASLSINLILPFINGLMLGFGEIIAHELGFHYNWFGANVSPL